MHFNLNGMYFDSLNRYFLGGGVEGISDIIGFGCELGRFPMRRQSFMFISLLLANNKKILKLVLGYNSIIALRAAITSINFNLIKPDVVIYSGRILGICVSSVR